MAGASKLILILAAAVMGVTIVFISEVLSEGLASIIWQALRSDFMRSILYFALPLFAASALSAVPAHSRGFGWFFSHSKPSGNCTGQEVVASYYSGGRRTASGQGFASGGLTAAHRTLPFGSQVTVRNPQNGLSVTVVVNDRGPFTRGVTLDLSRGAARAIGMRGTQYVCIS